MMEIFRHPKTNGSAHAEEAAAPAFFQDQGSDALARIDMPSGLARPSWSVRASLERADGKVRRSLEVLRSALQMVGQGGSGRVVSLAGLTVEQRALLADILGTGEVEIRIGGAPTYAIEETAFAGLWRGQLRDAGAGVVAEWLEVADVPETVRTAIKRFTVTDLPMPTNVPEGCMNVLPLLHELKTRMLAWRPGVPNHVMSLSLFPLSPADAATLTYTLGQAPIDMRSKGYGSCRVVPTWRRHIWGVQYFNVMDTVILDTLEVGDVPAAILAGREDFEDSARRLGEMLDAESEGVAA